MEIGKRYKHRNENKILKVFAKHPNVECYLACEDGLNTSVTFIQPLYYDEYVEYREPVCHTKTIYLDGEISSDSLSNELAKYLFGAGCLGWSSRPSEFATRYEITVREVRG